MFFVGVAIGFVAGVCLAIYIAHSYGKEERAVIASLSRSWLAAERRCAGLRARMDGQPIGAVVADIVAHDASDARDARDAQDRSPGRE